MPFRKKKQPTVEEQMDMEEEKNIEATHATDYGPHAAPDGVAFDYQVIEDENILRIFETNPFLAPIRPDFSRLNFLTNMTRQQANLAVSSLERKIKRLKYSRKSRNEKILCESLLDHFRIRINDSIGPHSKIDILATNRRVLQLERLKQKGGWLR